MPSALHELLVELFRHRPAFAAELLAEPLAVPVPRYARARVESSDLTDVLPTEYRADVVTVLEEPAGRTLLAMVVEAQLRPDPDKRWTWPVYLATLRARLRCPTRLLVVCTDPATARWCAEPITMGHAGWDLKPTVLTPDLVPMVTDPDVAAASPELSVLSAIAHGDDTEGLPVLEALLAALRTLDDAHATLYADVVIGLLTEHRREELMSTVTYREYHSDLVRPYVMQGRAEGEAKGVAKGEAKGKAEAVLAVLAARGITVSEAVRARITECSDTDRLDVWIRRAATADTASDLFA